MTIASASIAEDLSFLALRDVAQVVADLDIEAARIIGGHMVTLHVYRHALGHDLYRATADADLGVPPFAVRDAGVIEALLDRGYSRHSGNRYRRRVPELESHVDAPFAVVDVLVPAYTSRPRENRIVSDDLTTIEVPGLALALARPPVDVRLDVALVAGSTLEFDVRLPDEPSSFVMKALAWRQRAAPKDIVDVWRMLEVLAAGATMSDMLASDTATACDVARTAFANMRAAGTRSLATELALDDDALTRRLTRIRALMLRALPEA